MSERVGNPIPASKGEVGSRAIRNEMVAAVPMVRGRTTALLVAAALFAGFLLYLVLALHFDMMRSDVASYWKLSQEWRSPYNDWWVPGYPMMLALVRGVIPGEVDPLTLMVLTSGFWYLVAVLCVYAIVRDYRGSDSAAAYWASLFFAAFPIVGLTYSAYPVSDTTAIAFVLLSVLSAQRKHWLRLALFSGIALVMHKALWLFIPTLLVATFLTERESRAYLVFAPLPLLVWIVGGALHTGDPLWFMRWSVENLAASRSHLPVFDGLLGPFLSGSVTKIAKGLVVLVITAIAVVGAYRSLRIRYWTGVAICGGLILIALALNQYEIWAVVRFSRLLVVPLAYLLLRESPLPAGRMRGWLPGAALAGCVLTNIAYGYYMAVVFFH